MRRTNRVRGFTLIELMVSIAVIAIVASVGTLVYSNAQRTSRASKRVQDLQALKGALELYKTTTGSYPPQNGWACISSSLSVLAPKYMPVLPADPLDKGNAGGANCYQYTSAAGDPTVLTGQEFKLRTNPAIYTSGEMTSAAFGIQKTLIDPAKDGSANCQVDSGPYAGWSVYSGSRVCDD
jgi:general secretion pathway protein G